MNSVAAVDRSLIACWSASGAKAAIQAVADKYDLHNMTGQQIMDLGEDLYKAGAISFMDWGRLGIMGHMMAYPVHVNADGTVTQLPPDRSSTNDFVQRLASNLVFEQQHGSLANAKWDQMILEKLDALGQLRDAGPAWARS